MGAFLTAAGKFLAPVAKWIGVNVILPWLISKAQALSAYVKKKIEHAKRAKKAEQGNANYENNPSDDTFGDSP